MSRSNRTGNARRVDGSMGRYNSGDDLVLSCGPTMLES
jgi:hypothetical protein